MGAVGGGRGGRGGRGRKKGGKKALKRDAEVIFGDGYGSTQWAGLSSPWKTSRQKYGTNWMKDSHLGIVRDEAPSSAIESKFTLRQLEGEGQLQRRVSEMGWSRKGWSGKSMNGKFVGCPEAPNGEPLKDFYSVVVEFKRVSNQTMAGKKRTISALVVVGNGNGVAGFGVGRGEESFAAIRKAKNKAVNYLYFVPRYNDHTLYHNVQVKYKQTQVQLERRVQGTGLKCQRVIASIFQLAGIKDARAKIIGSNNPLNIVRATFKGLTSQKLHQSISDETRQFLIESRRECNYRPLVMAVSKSESSTQVTQQLKKMQMS